MMSKVRFNVSKIILPLELKDKFDLVSYTDGRVILKWQHSEQEVLIECSLEQINDSDAYGREYLVLSDNTHAIATLTFSSFGTNIDASVIETDEKLKAEIKDFDKRAYTVMCYGTCKLEIDFA